MTRVEKGRYKKTLADDVVAIPGLWADIDIAGGPHESKPYPPDLDAAIALANATGNAPTTIIRTGFGIQAWWLFPEPYIIEPGKGEADERAKLARISQDWNSTLRFHADRMAGWKIDSVFDLSRVMRVPGTMNLKVDGDPRRAEIHEMDESRRYELDDLTEYFADQKVLDGYAMASTGGKVASLEGVNLTEVWARVNSAAYRESRYTPEWLQAVLEIDGDAGPLSLLWAGNRKDLGNDASGYDASAARILHDYGYSVEHQIEAVMCRRLRTGEKLEKVDPARRADYYLSHTLGFVHRSAEQAGKKDAKVEEARTKATASAYGGRIAASTFADPAPDPAAYVAPPAPPEPDADVADEVPPPPEPDPRDDPFGEYVADVLDHDAAKPTPEERILSAAAQVEDEHRAAPEDREPPVTEDPPALGRMPEPEPDAEVWGTRSEQMIAMMEHLSDLLFPKPARERGFQVWRLERQDYGENQRARLGLKVPLDYDWPDANRPEHYRVGKPLFTDWYKRGDFRTPRGFRTSIQDDCFLPVEPVGNKEEWAALIDNLVPYWLRDSTGADLAASVHQWLLDYLLDHPATPDKADAVDRRMPFLQDHHNWGADGVPMILFALDPFLAFVASRPGGPKGRLAQGIIKFLHVEKIRPRMPSADGKMRRGVWYEVLDEQFTRGEWYLVIESAHEAYDQRGKRVNLRVVKGDTA